MRFIKGFLKQLQTLTLLPFFTITYNEKVLLAVFLQCCALRSYILEKSCILFLRKNEQGFCSLCDYWQRFDSILINFMLSLNVEFTRNSCSFRHLKSYMCIMFFLYYYYLVPTAVECCFDETPVITQSTLLPGRMILHTGVMLSTKWINPSCALWACEKRRWCNKQYFKGTCLRNMVEQKFFKQKGVYQTLALSFQQAGRVNGRGILCCEIEYT